MKSLPAPLVCPNLRSRGETVTVRRPPLDALRLTVPLLGAIASLPNPLPFLFSSSYTGHANLK